MWADAYNFCHGGPNVICFLLHIVNAHPTVNRLGLWALWTELLSSISCSMNDSRISFEITTLNVFVQRWSQAWEYVWRCDDTWVYLSGPSFSADNLLINLWRVNSSCSSTCYYNLLSMSTRPDLTPRLFKRIIWCKFCLWLHHQILGLREIFGSESLISVCCQVMRVKLINIVHI